MNNLPPKSNEDLDYIKMKIDEFCNNNELFFSGKFYNKEMEIDLLIESRTSSVDINNLNEISSPTTISQTNSLPSPAENSSILSSSSSSSITNSKTENELVLNYDNKFKYKMTFINTADLTVVNNYLFNCFEEFQQIPCKLLAKAWIKIIEPKKQSTFPYKKGELSKPFWWPEDCRHKEPDHLKKDERISLLVNILKIFKLKENELLHSAKLINELSPKDVITNSGDEFGLRKFKILKDMFKVVKGNCSPIQVIKPGKKYSSQIYQRALLKNKFRANSVDKELEISKCLLLNHKTIEPTSLNSVADKKSRNSNQSHPLISSSPFKTPIKNPFDITKASFNSLIDPRCLLTSIGNDENISLSTPKIGYYENDHLKLNDNSNSMSPFFVGSNNNNNTPLTMISPSQLNININSTNPLNNKLSFHHNRHHKMINLIEDDGNNSNEETILN